ncbi:MAG: protein-arginine deiminase family protein, partial [Pseudomonadota bacterium]
MSFRIKIFIILILLALGLGLQQYYVKSPIPRCPTYGQQFLPATFPVSHLFVGGPMATDLDSIVKKNYPSLAITLLKNLWVRDINLFFYSSEKKGPVIFDLAYQQSDGDLLPSLLAKEFSFPRLEYSLPMGGGDYGGNFLPLPGNLLAVGNTLSFPLEKFIKENFPHRIVRVNTSWLDIGHIDEIITLLPSTAKEWAPFVLIYASPQLAIDILTTNPFDPKKDFLFPLTDNAKGAIDLGEQLDNEQRPDFISCIPLLSRQEKEISAKLKNYCHKWQLANEQYESIIQKDLKVLVEEIFKFTGQRPRILPLPQLFSPNHLGEIFGLETDHALPINPNSINLLSLEKVAIIPKQFYLPFQQYMEKNLAPLELRPHFI